MHILPVLAGLEVLVLGGGPDIFFRAFELCIERKCDRRTPPRAVIALVLWSARAFILVIH